MIYHSKYNYIKQVIDSGMPILLTGEAGTGKTTIAKQLADEMGLPFYTMSMTKQSSVNSLIGFTSINGVYIPTQLRQAFENGGIFLLDEIDAADPNVLLVLNNIENGFISFPDGIINMHPDFRLIATANPFNEHAIYTGRSKLDFSTVDRYFIIELERDKKLEAKLICKETKSQVDIVRKVLKRNGSTLQCTMRDAIRISKLKELGISKCEIKDVVFGSDKTFYKEWESDYQNSLPKDEPEPTVKIVDDIEDDKPLMKDKVNDWKLREIAFADWEPNIGIKPDIEDNIDILFNNDEIIYNATTANWNWDTAIDSIDSRVIKMYRRSKQ